MVGMTKECIVCGSNFQTKSMKASSWQRYCHACYEQKRANFATRNIKQQQSNMFDSLDKRMKELETKNEHIDMIISAEIANALSGLSNNDLFESVRNSIEETLSQKMKQIDEENKKFREKIQNQLVMLNNKLVKIMQEMNE